MGNLKIKWSGGAGENKGGPIDLWYFWGNVSSENASEREPQSGREPTCNFGIKIERACSVVTVLISVPQSVIIKDEISHEAIIGQASIGVAGEFCLENGARKCFRFLFAAIRC
jgi:hypothetical protein